MKTPSTGSPPVVKSSKPPEPRPRWWLRYVTDGTPPKRRAVVRWSRIFGALGVLAVAGYLSLATALWAYYRIHREIPGVQWIDIAIIPRFPRVQAAIGAHYLTQAQSAWEKRDYLRAILTARAAVQKAPENLEASLFLAKCWQDAARPDEAIRTLQSAMAFQAKDVRLQKALVEICLLAGRYTELIKLLRVEFPALGVNLLRGGDRGFQLAEVRAVLESSGAAEAVSVVASHPGLDSTAEAAPVLALIDWELGRKEPAFQRLKNALERAPNDAGIHDAYVDFCLRLDRLDEARKGAKKFLDLNPNLVPAQMRFLEAFDPLRGGDRQTWMNQCVRCLVQYRRVPAAMQRLGNVAASRGWTDLAFLLYENSLQETLKGFPYVIFYLSSLLKTGDFMEADVVWQDLAIRNAEQLATVPFLNAMVAFGAGRESEAQQVVERIRRETVEKPRERRKLAEVFVQFGFPKIAQELTRPDVGTEPVVGTLR